MAVNPWVKWILVIVAGMTVVVACGLVGVVWFVSSRMAPDVEIGQAIPSIDLTNFDGELVGLEGYRGRVVVLDFWSSW